MNRLILGMLLTSLCTISCSGHDKFLKAQLIQREECPDEKPFKVRVENLSNKVLSPLSISIYDKFTEEEEFSGAFIALTLSPGQFGYSYCLATKKYTEIYRRKMEEHLAAMESTLKEQDISEELLPLTTIATPIISAKVIEDYDIVNNVIVFVSPRQNQ